METSKREWLTPNTVYSEYGISTSTLAKWRMENKHLSFSKIGKYIKYKRSDIEAFLSTNMINAIVTEIKRVTK
ncbi:helix-turn-helix domain-containing protein [Aliarcobacter butzleri]|uniref:helix-turn-helix domain-containing protein n=1 Tax=Aliarcobacter butzleri TaxID=28197 RepID=UPI002B24FFA4|nr:helix-turn-helix domain-containing protein [Aliarcobacter butzleri]